MKICRWSISSGHDSQGLVQRPRGSTRGWGGGQQGQGRASWAEGRVTRAKEKTCQHIGFCGPEGRVEVAWEGTWEPQKRFS